MINMKKPWKEGFPAPMLWEMQKPIFNFARNEYWSKNNRSHGAGRPNFHSGLTTIYLRYTCQICRETVKDQQKFLYPAFLEINFEQQTSINCSSGLALSYKAIKSFKMLFGWWVSFDQVNKHFYTQHFLKLILNDRPLSIVVEVLLFHIKP